MNPSDMLAALNSAATAASPTTVNIDFGDETVQFTLHQESCFSQGAMMTVYDSLLQPILIDLVDKNTFRGYVNNDTTQIASFVVFDGSISGYYLNNGQMYMVAPLEDILEPATPYSPSFVFIKTGDTHGAAVDCLTPNGTPVTIRPPDEVTERESCKLFFEIAYDISNSAFDLIKALKLPGDPRTDLEFTRDKVKSINNLVQMPYAATAANFKFSITKINIRDKPDGFYTSSDYHTLWDQCKGQWKSSAFSCYKYDGVAAIIGQSFGALGYVDPDGFETLCGSKTDGSCHWNPFSIERFQTSDQSMANTIAHEIGHIFGLIHPSPPNGSLMDTQNSGGSTSSTFSSQDKIRIAARCPKNSSNTTCFQGESQNGHPWGDCLVSEPPVDNGFNPTLSGSAVIVTKDRVCGGDVFWANFYNQSYPAIPVTWELGPGLTDVTPGAPTTSLTRKISANAVTSCTPTVKSYIMITFPYNCGTVKYRKEVLIGSSIKLEGSWYKSPYPYPTHPLLDVQYLKAGNYQLLMGYGGLYTWKLNGVAITPANPMAFTLSASNSPLVFEICAPATAAECGTTTRRAAFYYKADGQSLVRPPSQPSAATLSPNPVTDILTVVPDANWGETESSSIDLSVVNAQGQRVFSSTISRYEPFHINTMTWPVGMYFVSFKTPEESFCEKFMKVSHKFSFTTRQPAANHESCSRLPLLC